VDIRFTHANGREERVRKVSPVQTKRGAEQYERQLREALLDGTYGREEAAPPLTVSAFWKDFLENYVEVNNKPSEQSMKRSIFKHHIEPRLGEISLDAVGAQLEPFKASLRRHGLGAKRINNVLAVVSKMLRYAEEREVIGRAPRVRLLKTAQSKYDFFTFEEYEQLLATASSEPEWRATILVAAEAGLRMGEIIALEWSDVNLQAGNLVVRRSSWLGIVGTTKGGRDRTIPISKRLAAALKGHRHLRGSLVFCSADGAPLTRNKMKKPLWAICKRAGLRNIGWHSLRHTFCSHLAMKGAPPRAIQELAGHTSITTTMRYMHLAPSALREAVRLLDERAPVGHKEGTKQNVPAAGPETICEDA
jgi:integrase